MARARTGSRGVKEWGGTTFNEITITTTQGILTTFIEAGSPSTILRVRGNIAVQTTPDAASDDDVLGLGLIIVSDASAAIGGSSVPGPIADPASPWIWHQYVPFLASTTAIAGDAILQEARVEIDSKAMRKLGINETAVLVGEMDTGSFAAVTATGGIRVLVLHG